MHTHMYMCRSRPYSVRKPHVVNSYHLFIIDIRSCQLYFSIATCTITNSLTSEILYLNFPLLEVASRYRDPQNFKLLGFVILSQRSSISKAYVSFSKLRHLFYFARAILKNCNYIHVPYLLVLVENAYEQHENDWDLNAEDNGVGLNRKKRIEDGTHVCQQGISTESQLYFPWCQQGCSHCHRRLLMTNQWVNLEVTPAALTWTIPQKVTIQPIKTKKKRQKPQWMMQCLTNKHIV